MIHQVSDFLTCSDTVYITFVYQSGMISDCQTKNFRHIDHVDQVDI